MSNENTVFEPSETDIAIVGMAAHLPGAPSITAFWDNLKNGVSSIRHLSEDELLAAGEDPGLMRHKNYVPAAATLADLEMFDAEFFGFSPKEAAIMDPQHRHFLEVAWEALENAGHPPENFAGPIGVYAGCGMGSYFYFNICSNPDLVDDVGLFLLRHTGNDKDFLATRASHVLDLNGPSINMQTACSTSLVATHYACQALLSGECDMALAGGVTIELPHGRGYLFRENEVLSPDGQCHAFDHRAQGTVFGSGAGVVALRRLKDALADGDHIWGVIKGSAVNNDGSAKAGYLAPSVDGQAAAIAEAQAIADVSAETVDYIECHGTGTYLGDPIEVAALTWAFRQTTDESGFCRLGSVKTNIGHLDTAAGAASLIKTALSLHNRQIPPSLGYEAPNPSIPFEGSPFSVNDRLSDWVSTHGPRRAGVNSLGVGGTNAHVVVEEAPTRMESEASDWPFHILPISGRTKSALDANATALADHLETHPDLPLADVAYTLKEGRRAFEKRRVLVAGSQAEAVELLRSNDTRRVFTHSALADKPEIVFMFPGGGSQYIGMAKDLYETEPVFQEWMDRGLALIDAQLGGDIRALWLAEASDEAEEALGKSSVQLPLIVVVEYALARLWMSWGVEPDAMVGHSLGEYTAACLANVFSFEACIGLVIERAKLIDKTPPGGTISVPLALGEIEPFLGDALDVACLNAPNLTVISGPFEALDALVAKLAEQEIECQRVPVQVAAHARHVDPILKEFGDYLRTMEFAAPDRPLLSNRTGTFMTAEQAMDPDYWVSHLRHTVQFADCVTTLSQQPNRVYLEVGPGKGLGALVKIHGAVPAQQVIGSLRHPEDPIEDDAFFLSTIGRLWALGVDADWSQIWGEARRHRLPLPTYQFQRSPYFIEAGEGSVHQAKLPLARTDAIEDWGYRPVWRPEFAACVLDVERDLDQMSPENWLIFMDNTGLGQRLSARLKSAGHAVTPVFAGDAFANNGADGYVIAPERGRDSYDLVIQDLVAQGQAPSRILHLWLTTDKETFRPGSSFFHRNQEQGFYSLMFLAQALSDENVPTPLHITAVTTGAARLRDEALPYPEKACILGPIQVIPKELPGVTCAAIDIELPTGAKQRSRDEAMEELTNRLLEDLAAPPENMIAAFRGAKRLRREYLSVELTPVEEAVIKQGETVLITGGAGGIGLAIAERLVREQQANIVLVGRTSVPDEDNWAHYLHTHAENDPASRAIRGVERLRALGGDAIFFQADVCNVEDMEAAAESAKARFGKVSGVIHGAGVVDDAPLLAKTSAEVEDVFTPKLHGTHVLEAVFPDGSIDWLVLFSSTSTATAPIGQIDYVAANAYLNAYAQARAGGKTRVQALNWGIWGEVGMAARAEEEADSGPLVIADETRQPLLTHSGFTKTSDRIFEARWSAKSEWVLDQHRTKSGRALLPGTGYLELAAEALDAHGEHLPFEIRDLFFLRPFNVLDDTPRVAQLRLERSEEGYHFGVDGDVTVKGRQGFLTQAEGRLALGHLPAPKDIDPEAILARCPTREEAADGATLVSPQEVHLAFGASWRVLKRTAMGEGEGIAHLSLPDSARGHLDQGFLLHPALMDLATGWAMGLIPGYVPDHLWVPVSYGSVKVHKPLPADVVSWARLRTASEDGASFDIVIADPSGAVCVEVTNFAIHRIESEAAFGSDTVPAASEVRFVDQTGDAQPRSEAEERLQHHLTQGIRPDEGAESFLRTQAMPFSEVIVSSMNLDALISEAATPAAQANSAQSFQRPDLETDFVAPETDIERTLAGFWQELLGVEQVGTEDSFFDLGGHSLIAVRLFAMVRKAYRVDFPISILFEAPTIKRCAALISEQIGEVASPDAPAEAEVVAAPSRRFTHLVPMHAGEGGSRTPFFLVAGMFGNVLNLRHLAHLIGSDRPFYGLQAKGLLGDDAPHTDLKDAARDYIAEMRQVQPHGPYLLGGFSGGGLTAFEMAQQLEAVGETVALVAMLDTPLAQRRPLERLDRMLIHWEEFKSRGLRYPFEWARNRIAWEFAKRRPKANDVAGSQHHFHNDKIEAGFMESIGKYQMVPWDGPLVLYRPPLRGKWHVSKGRLIDSQRTYVLADNDWGGYVPGIEVYEVPGDHDSMVLEPNVRVLGNRLKARIEEAERGFAQPWNQMEAAE